MHRNIKCVIVGDKDVGKTSMIYSYIADTIVSMSIGLRGHPTTYFMKPLVYISPRWHVPELNLKIDENPVLLSLWETLATEEHDRLRPSLDYPGTDVFLVCFSVVVPESLENVLNKWIPEVRLHCPNTPAILVGTQLDLREEAKSTQPAISYNQGAAFAKKNGFLKYVECSAKSRVGLDSVFEEAAVKAVLYPQVEQKSCFIL